MQTDKADVIVVGAGVIGCAIAYLLSKEGMKVVIVDKDGLADHASGTAPGLLSRFSLARDGVMTSLGRQSYQMHEELYPQLKEESGLDYYFRETASMRLAFNEEEVAELKLRVDLVRKKGFKRVRWLDRDDVLNLESRVSPEVLGATYQEGADMESYRFALALVQAAEKKGAEVRSGEVIGLTRNGTKATALELSSRSIHGEHIILAMGPWAGMASSWLGVPVPVRPLRGHAQWVRMPGAPFVYGMSCSGNYLLITTKRDGLTYLGSTHEEAGFDDQPTDEGIDYILKGALTMVPSLMDVELVRRTACLRPLSADELPIIGKVPGWDNVYLATGHGAQGILLSTVTARIITDLAVKRTARDGVVGTAATPTWEKSSG